MVKRANLIERGGGLEPEGEGWFVLNARDARWYRSEVFGSSCGFEAQADGAEFPQLGINLHVIDPGQPNCMYHGEAAQENFLVLKGDCLLLIEGGEVPLKAWDLVHCPPWTEHVFVGGSERCVLLMVGARTGEEGVVYPVSPLAQEHGAGVAEETRKPREAYAAFPSWGPAPYRDDDLSSG